MPCKVQLDLAESSGVACKPAKSFVGVPSRGNWPKHAASLCVCPITDREQLNVAGIPPARDVKHPEVFTRSLCRSERSRGGVAGRGGSASRVAFRFSSYLTEMGEGRRA